MFDEQIDTIIEDVPSFEFVIQEPYPCCGYCTGLFSHNGDETDDYHGVQSCEKHPQVIFGYEPHRLPIQFTGNYKCEDFECK